jgi:hypothetical protein
MSVAVIGRTDRLHLYPARGFIDRDIHINRNAHCHHRLVRRLNVHRYCRLHRLFPFVWDQETQRYSVPPLPSLSRRVVRLGCDVEPAFAAAY